MQGTYYEAAVTDINPADQVLTANFPRHAGLEQFSFQIPYDIMIYSVGSNVNTFGIKVLLPHTRATLDILACHISLLPFLRQQPFRTFNALLMQTFEQLRQTAGLPCYTAQHCHTAVLC